MAIGEFLYFQNNVRKYYTVYDKRLLTMEKRINAHENSGL